MFRKPLNRNNYDTINSNKFLQSIKRKVSAEELNFLKSKRSGFSGAKFQNNQIHEGTISVRKKTAVVSPICRKEKPFLKANDTAVTSQKNYKSLSNVHSKNRDCIKLDKNILNANRTLTWENNEKNSVHKDTDSIKLKNFSRHKQQFALQNIKHQLLTNKGNPKHTEGKHVTATKEMKRKFNTESNIQTSVSDFKGGGMTILERKKVIPRFSKNNFTKLQHSVSLDEELTKCVKAVPTTYKDGSNYDAQSTSKKHDTKHKPSIKHAKLIKGLEDHIKHKLSHKLDNYDKVDFSKVSKITSNNTNANDEKFPVKKQTQFSIHSNSKVIKNHNSLAKKAHSLQRSFSVNGNSRIKEKELVQKRQINSPSNKSLHYKHYIGDDKSNSKLKYKDLGSITFSTASGDRSKHQINHSNKFLKTQTDEPINRLNTTKVINTEATTSGLPVSALNTSNEDYDSDVEMDDISEDLPSLDIFTEAMEVDHLADNQEGYAFVVDTNIFIHHLTFIDELKDTPLEGTGPPCIYIPWIVIRELDGLKAGPSSEKKSKAVEAVRYIFFMFDSKHPRIRGQTAKMSNELPRTFGDTNDDILLSYYTDLSGKLLSDKVILLTDDKNLCSKAMINEIKVCTKDNLYSRIKPDITTFRDRNYSLKYLGKEGYNDLENSRKLENNKKMVDAILCETRFLAKEILEPFLYKSMKEVFNVSGKSILTPPPTGLVEILECYKKYWISVFGTLFSNSKKHFETLIRLFSYRRGFFCDPDDAFAVLIAVESICNGIMKYEPGIAHHVQRISELTDKCKILSHPTSEEDNEEQSNCNNNLSQGQSNSEITYEVFNHIWKLMMTLCGMIMDFAGISHGIVYDKPSTLPAVSEFFKLLCNLYPAMHKIKAMMSDIVDIDTKEKQAKHENSYKKLYDYLLQFVPSLQIQADYPPIEKFTVASLKSFCIDPNYRDQLKAGYRQLLEFQQSLVQCSHLPIWSD